MAIRSGYLLLTAILSASTLLAQEPPPPPQQPPTPPPQTAPQNPPQTTPQNPPQTPPTAPQPEPQPPATSTQEAAPPPTTTQEAPPPPPLSQTASGTYERRDTFPNFNLYLPEGQASVRLRKLIKNVLFESQIDYQFVNGDINTFLRYKYYARSYTYMLSIFDTIGFPSIGSTSTQEFQRVRGGLLLAEYPRNYNNRFYWLTEDDRLTFGNLTTVDNRKNNIYTKFGYQYGTRFDEALDAIVGETRGRIIPVLTAFRDLGPEEFSFAAAVTQSAKFYTGRYQYTKVEAEGLKRWDITPTTFVVTRAHVGLFPYRTVVRDWCTDLTNQVCGTGTPPAGAVLVDPIERYSIPAYEMFPLGGRDGLVSVGASNPATGTTETHMTNEYFVPVFRNRDYRTRMVHWNTLYGVGYVGVGNVGYQLSDAARVKNYTVDAGLGSEIALTVRDFDVLLSVLVARSVRDPLHIGGTKFRFSVRTVR